METGKIIRCYRCQSAPLGSEVSDLCIRYKRPDLWIVEERSVAGRPLKRTPFSSLSAAGDFYESRMRELFVEELRQNYEREGTIRQPVA